MGPVRTVWPGLQDFSTSGLWDFSTEEYIPIFAAWCVIGGYSLGQHLFLQVTFLVQRMLDLYLSYQPGHADYYLLAPQAKMNLTKVCRHEIYILTGGHQRSR